MPYSPSVQYRGDTYAYQGRPANLAALSVAFTLLRNTATPTVDVNEYGRKHSRRPANAASSPQIPRLSVQIKVHRNPLLFERSVPRGNDFPNFPA
jgi:hypothetical protein